MNDKPIHTVIVFSEQVGFAKVTIVLRNKIKGKEVWMKQMFSSDDLSIQRVTSILV